MKKIENNSKAIIAVIILTIFIFSINCSDDEDISHDELRIISFSPTQIDTNNSSTFDLSFKFSKPMVRIESVQLLLQTTALSMQLINKNNIDFDNPKFIDNIIWSEDDTRITMTFNALDKYSQKVNFFAYGGSFKLRYTYGNNYSNGGLSEMKSFISIPNENLFRSKDGTLLNKNTVLCDINITGVPNPPKITGKLKNTSDGIVYLKLKTDDSNYSDSFYSVIDTKIETNYQIYFDNEAIKDDNKYYVEAFEDLNRRNPKSFSALVDDKSISDSMKTEKLKIQDGIYLDLDFSYSVKEIYFKLIGATIGKCVIYVWNDKDNIGDFEKIIDKITFDINGNPIYKHISAYTKEKTYYISAYVNLKGDEEFESTCITLSGGKENELGNPIEVNFDSKKTDVILSFSRVIN